MKTNLILCFIVTMFLLFLSEAALRVLDYPESIQYGWQGKEATVERKRRNQLGYRGRSIAYTDNDYVIVLLGDSQVENSGRKKAVQGLPEVLLEKGIAQALPGRCLSALQKKQVKVYSVGTGGWGQDQQLLALSRFFELFRADMVVLWETPENDIWNNAFPTHYPLNGTPKPTFTISGDGSAVAVAKSEIIPHWMQSRLGLLAYKFIVILDESSLLDRLSEVLFGDRNYIRLYRWNPDHYWDKYLPDPLQVDVVERDIDSTQYLSKFSPYIGQDPIELEKSHFSIGLNDGSRRLEWMARLTNLLIKEIEGLARTNGAEFFAFSYSAESTSQPVYPPPGRYTVKGKTFFYSKAAAERRMAIINDGIEYHQITLTRKRWRRRELDPHLSRAGNEEVANALAQIVVQNLCK